MRLATVVQHHPARAALLPGLLERLDGLDPVVVTDPGADEAKWSAWRCYESCLRAMPDDATHLLIVQDDVVPCRGFAEGARAALTARPDAIVAFFLGGRPAMSARALTAAASRCEAWSAIDRHEYVPLVCAAFPRADVLELIEWAATWTGNRNDDDSIVGRFVKVTGRQAYATVPSLVQHPDTVPSLTHRRAQAGRDKGRVAACFIGDYAPTLIEW